MKRFFALLSLIAVVAVAVAQVGPLAVDWELKGFNKEKRNCSCELTICNVGNENLSDNWALYFNNFPRTFVVEKNCPFTIDKVQTGYFKLTPKKGFKLSKGKTAKVKYTVSGVVPSLSYAPDGGHVTIGDAAPLPAPIRKKPMKKGTFATIKAYPTGEKLYELYSSVNNYAGYYDPFEILPGLKVVEKTGEAVSFGKFNVVAESSCVKAQNYAVAELKSEGLYDANGKSLTLKLISRSDAGNDAAECNEEYYELTIAANGWTVAGVSKEAVLDGVKTVMALVRKNLALGEIPSARVYDWADLGHRGVMIDIARNYTELEDIKSLLKTLAEYKINFLHFHLADDEGWRLEIPGIPELTSVGGRRGLTTTEDEFMCQFYSGDGNPNSKTTSNGHISRSEFVEFLKYCDALGINVAVEIDTPGHSRAAITSLKARYKKYIESDPVEANRYRVWDLEDKSEYASVQGYKDNVLNVAEEGTYRFMEKVLNELMLMYEQAGIEMPFIHVGGDEVAKNPWAKSPAVQKLMKEKGFKTTHDVEEYYISRIAEMAEYKGVKLGGWQEAAMRHAEKTDKFLRNKFAVVNCWETVPEWGGDSIPYSVANDGYKVVLCNVGNFYLDMAYNAHQSEPGLNWGGYVDEYRSWDCRPYRIYDSSTHKITGEPLDMEHIADGKPVLNDESKKNIIGVQGQLFAETIRSFEMMQYFFFPKVFGLAERGWNVEPLRYQSKSAYNNYIGTVLLPQLQKAGINFRIGMPGIVVKDGKVYMNSAYPQAEIRYTTDGSEPTINSKKWTAPIKPAKKIKAKTFYLGKESFVTEL